MEGVSATHLAPVPHNCPERQGEGRLPLPPAAQSPSVCRLPSRSRERATRPVRPV